MNDRMEAMEVSYVLGFTGLHVSYTKRPDHCPVAWRISGDDEELVKEFYQKLAERWSERPDIKVIEVDGWIPLSWDDPDDRFDNWQEMTVDIDKVDKSYRVEIPSEPIDTWDDSDGPEVERCWAPPMPVDEPEEESLVEFFEPTDEPAPNHHKYQYWDEEYWEEESDDMVPPTRVAKTGHRKIRRERTGRRKSASSRPA